MYSNRQLHRLSILVVTSVRFDKTYYGFVMSVCHIEAALLKLMCPVTGTGYASGNVRDAGGTGTTSWHDDGRRQLHVQPTTTTAASAAGFPTGGYFTARLGRMPIEVP